MNVSNEQLAEMLKNERFPLSAKYDPQWVLENEMGPHPLWLMEWLCEEMALKPGMRVLDMGCGKAITSIFLAKEFGVQVWANDLWIPANDNWKRIREAGVEDRVFPIHAEAHALPYADDFFDAIVCVDSYMYYGTDDLYLSYFQKFVKPGGKIGVVNPGLTKEFDGAPPEYLTRKLPSGGAWWDPTECFSFHTAHWWRRHWSQTELVNIDIADTDPNGCRNWLRFEEIKLTAGTNRHEDETHVFREDQGRYLGFIRLVAQREENQS